MFRKILAGTDGSDSATLALDHAVHLAERLDADLTILTAHRRPDPSVTSGSTEAVIAGALLRDVEAAYGGRVTLETRMAAGDAAGALLDFAQMEGHDLVVVGNRGISLGGALQPGSVPERVSRRAPAAVLVVDTVGRRPPGYRRILVATDGSETAAKAVEAGITLANALDADLGIATVASSDREGRRVVSALQARWPDVATHVLDGEPSEALSDLTQSGRYDLLILGNKGMTGLRRAMGSVPARVLRRAPTTVLIVHTTG